MGGFEQIGETNQKDPQIDLMVAEALSTSGIEGEIFD